LKDLISISAFLYGLPVGFAFSFALGPVFFSLIRSSLEQGFRAAVYIAIGVIVADLVLLGIAYSGVQAFLPQSIDVAFWVQIFGGILLLSLGIFSIRKKAIDTEGVTVDTHYIYKNLASGFFLNILNPANFMEWVGAAGILKTKYHFETYQNISFFTGALLAVFMTELAVAYFAARLKKVLNANTMQRINTLSGIVFIGFGLWLFWEAYKGF
jgi:L-lysine exporter family protein LysE/ArgO